MFVLAPGICWCKSQGLLRKGYGMHELFLLVAIMVATFVLLGGMMVLFKGYLARREEIEQEAGR